MKHERISQDPAIMVGKACIKGTRIPVDIILRLLGRGETIEDVLEAYPHITREDVLAALDYAADCVAGETVFAAE